MSEFSQPVEQDENTPDPETAALMLVDHALRPLDLEAVKRVLHWADQRFVRNQVYDSATTAMAAATERLLKMAERAERAGISKQEIRAAVYDEPAADPAGVSS